MKHFISTCIFSTIYRTVSNWLKKIEKSRHENRQITKMEISELEIFCFSKVFKFSRNFCWNFEKLQKSWYKTNSLPRLRNFWVLVEQFFSVPCLTFYQLNLSCFSTSLPMLKFYSTNFIFMLYALSFNRMSMICDTHFILFTVLPIQKFAHGSSYSKLKHVLMLLLL